MSKKKLAVIGCGLIGNKHAKIIDNLENLELCGVVGDQKSIKDFNLSCKVFSDIRELLINQKVDGAIIATPTPMHSWQL